MGTVLHMTLQYGRKRPSSSRNSVVGDDCCWNCYCCRCSFFVTVVVVDVDFDIDVVVVAELVLFAD
jgi:hypothetical protein